MLSDDQLAPIVQDFYAYVLDQENRLRLQLGAIPEEARLRRAEFFKRVATQARTDLACNVFGNVYFIALAMMRKHNIEATLDKEEKNQLRQALLRGGIDLAEAVRARYEGDFNYEPRDKLLKQKIEALFAASPATVPPKTSIREPSRAPEGPTFTIVSADFVSKQKQLHRWENQTAAQNNKSYELFSAVCGDYPLAKYTKMDAAKFKDVIERLPADYGKAAQYRGKTPQQILQIDAASGHPNGCPFVR
jgi:hypothetical protein